MFIFSPMSNFEEEDEQGKEMSNQIAIEISKENVAHVAENKILEEQNKIDDQTRNEYKQKMFDQNTAKEKVVESERWSKQIEYRQFLLKQIEDKEKNKKCYKSPEIQGNAYAYSEERMTPEGMKNLKLTKQQEMKNGLDECIRMKKALKLENKQKELEEDRLRDEFWKKREANELMVREKVKQQIEIKEQRTEEAARQWRANTDDEREEFSDILLENDTILSEASNDVVEVEKEIPKQEHGEEEEDKNEIGLISKENLTNEIDQDQFWKFT